MLHTWQASKVMIINTVVTIFVKSTNYVLRSFIWVEILRMFWFAKISLIILRVTFIDKLRIFSILFIHNISNKIINLVELCRYCSAGRSGEEAMSRLVFLGSLLPEWLVCSQYGGLMHRIARGLPGRIYKIKQYFFIYKKNTFLIDVASFHEIKKIR